MLKFFSDTWKSRYLITTWAKYNIESTYLEAKLGVLWIILQPIIEALIYTAVFGFILDRKPRGDAPFVLFFLSGMILWNFFSNAMVRSATLMNSKIITISQIKFPNQTLVFVFILEKFVDFLVAFVVLLSFNAFFGIFPSVAFIYIPVILLVFFTMTIGLMFILATLGVFVQDIAQITGLALRFLLYFSGVLISSDMVPKKIANFLNLNPVFFMVESFRNVVLYAEPPNFPILGIWMVISIVFLFAGIYIFLKNDGLFADYQ